MFNESDGKKVKVTSVDPQFRPVEVTIETGENGKPGTVIKVEPAPPKEPDKKQG